MNKINLRVFAVTLLSVLLLNVADVFAGTAYSDGRAYLRQGSPQNAGKVYVSTSSSTPAASSYKACNTVQTSETTAPSASAQVSGEKKTTTYHFWATANTGYIFTGWYNSNGVLQGSGAAHISASVTSGQAGGSDTHAYLDMHASFIKQIQMSFITPTNGSYTITHCGTEVTPAYSSFTTEGKVVLSAMPADGYKLRGWYTTTNGGTTKKYFAFGTTCEPNFTSNVTIGADFVADDGKATFWNKNNGKIYNDLNTANSEASSGHVIVAVSDGVLGAGTYTIKAGVTLLIPYDETYNLMTTPKVVHYTSAGSAPALSAFRRLTLAEGAIINVSGNICIGGQQTAVNGGNPTSQPCGAAGVLDISRGGTINLKSGSNLYAWGFVKGQDMDQGNNTDASGVGVINAADGATVWEDFQCGEWRGGTASSTIYSNKGSWKFFPFQSYTIQNIEAPVTYAYGSKLQCHWAIFGNGSTFTVTFPLVAKNTDSSLFKLATGGTLRKWYDPTTDRVCYELGGAATVDALNLNVLGESVSSSDYNLPIPANMHIILKSGNTLTISKPMTAHAGAVVEVKSGATLNVNAKVYMYDADDWDTYCMYTYYYRTYKNLTSHYDRGTGTSKTNLEDATLIVDGTVNIANQCLYATAHGASIIGNGGGTFKYNTLPSNTTMTQCKVLSDNVSVNIRSANLRNDNGSYTKGIASTTFKNVNGRWFTSAKSTEKANHTYDFTYIKSGDVYGTAGTNGTVSACYSKDKTGLALQDKWANIKAEGCDNWWTGIDDSHLYNYTLNSAWHQYIKTGSTVAEEGEEPIVTYAGSDGKVYQKQGCDIVVDGTMENCLYGTKALVNGAFVTVVKNTEDEAYHKSDAATTYYLCFDGCVWHPATRNAENLYTVDGTKYIWYNNAWLAVTYDSTVKFYYSLSATNVRIYYEYVNHAWVLASPVAEVVTSAGTEQVYSLEDAKTKAKAGGTNVTIRLLKDMKITSAFTYDGANNCSLDLNGFTLTGTVTSMITINNAAATFIIKDQSAAGTGKIQATFNRSTDKVYGLNVTKGHIVLNSGTVHIENTDASQGACGVYIYSGYKFTINGGTLEVKSKGETWGIHTLETTTSVVTVNGGTIDTKTTSTSAALVGIHSLGGTININGGTLATSTTTVKTGLTKGIEATNAKTILNVTGGTIESTAPSKVYGLKIAGASPVTISGGKIIATAKDSLKAYGVISEAAGALTINGGKIYANAKTNYAYGLYTGTGRTIINSNDTIHATAVSRYAYGVYTYNSAGRVWFNNGVVDVTAPREVYGLYVYASTDTINGGEFLVHASGSSRAAYGIYLRDNANPKCMVNGGKFKVTAATSSYAHINTSFANNIGKLKLAGGYFNITPDSANFVVAGKSVKDVDRTKEQAIYDAGYVKKIAGNEYTVTWKDHAGNVIGTSQVESGKVPVWTGGEVNVSDANSTREHNGWSTAAWNGGTSYVFPTALPAIGASDVTYFAHYQAIYADVTTGGVTTRYNSAQKAWTAAMAAKQATIRLLSNLGTEASIGNMTQMVFDPTNANSVIIMDLNGHSWTMGRHATAANNTSPFIHVNPAQTGCKLIITDNSASGNGYLMNSWEKTDGALTCIQVSKGELVLQKGALKVKNTASSQYSNGVYVGGANAHFTMTGGTVYSTDGYSPRGVCVGDGYADIAGGTVEANSTASEAYALLSYDTVTVSGGATIKATGATGSTYGTYCNGAAAVLNIDSAIIISNAYQTSKGIYSLGGGKTTVDGKSSISATTTTGSGAYALYATGANTKITANDGTYTATSALNSAYGVFAENNGAAIVNGGSFTVTATGTNARGVYAQSNGAVTVKGGSLDVTSDTHADPSSFGAYVAGGTVNIEDGNFTLNVHKDLSNRNCDLARCGTGVSYLNISGGTFTGDSAYHAVRSFGGETMITGNPVFTAQRGVDAGAWASADGTAKVTIDGGTFYCTDNFALYATTHTYNGKTVVGDMTVLDGKFHTKSSIKPVYTSSRPIYLKIKGGYFTSYTASDISNNALDSFVVAPSYTTAVESTDPMYASPNDYRYRVNTKFTVTWKDGATTLKTQEYNRNEIPSYGGDYNPSTSAETYEFLGWSPAIGPVTKDTTYTALKQKYEAEVFETGSATTRRYTTFEAAWADVQKIENGTLRILSNCYKGTTLTYNPAPAEGVAEGTPGYFTTATTTIDLNGHTYNNHASTTDTYALEMKKAGCKLIITDTSGKTSGYFGHMNYNAPNCRYRGIKLEQGELVLAGGTLRAQNTYPYLADDSEDFSSSGAYTVLVYAGTTFTMTGGTLLAEAHKNARAVCFVGNGVANISGGEIKVLAQYKKKDDATQYYGAGAYGVIADNSGGTANISGTVTITSKAYSSAIGVYVNASTNAAEANISGGSIDCWAKTQASMPVYCYQTKAVTNISGGSFKANCSQDASAWNTETVSVHKGATVNISGGTYESTTGSNCNAVRNFGGTVTITGNPLFKTRQGVNAGDYAEATQTATIYVNGGTFNTKGYCFYANTNTRESYTVTGKVYVNAGYFNSYGGSICSGTAGTNLVLNGGYYKERSGTSTKTNITTYKGATTTVSTLSPAITVADTTYHYQLLTDFNITWLGGESYSKVTQVKSGVVPTNTDLDGKCFLRNDSAFYFTGWTPTPIGVIGDATYNAAGVYHEASVKVGSAEPIIYDDFDEAWAYAMEQSSATITLLTNLTRTSSIVYNPAPANARHTFDLNNFTIKENTTDRLLIVNKTGAHLTITDNSSAKGGCLYKKMESSTNVYTTVVYHGELILAGGKLYVENTKDDKGWHPAECVHVSRSTDGIFTMTGGTVESQAKYLAYPLYNYATTNISGGTIIANATTQGAAQGLYAVAGTATISGGTWNISSTTSGAVGAAATGWVNTTGTPRENGVLNITGGTFNVSAAISNVQGIKSYATGKRIDGTNYSAHGIVNVSGGTFNVTCSAATATQVFAAHVDAWRLFDNALPHTLLAEARGEMNISGGTFTVDARNNGAWVANSGNVDLLRNWGILNVSGGNFTIHQYRTPSAISVFRGKATVTGNPVFNVYAHTGNAYAVCAGYWTHESYCDKNAANNLAEAEVNGGTYNIITEGQNTNVIYSLGQISAESRDAVADTITAHAGYAMNAKITVNGGTFLGICPNESGKYPIMLNSRVDLVGTYGTAKSEIYVNGGKFKSRKGTSYESSTTTGAVNCHNDVGTLLLTGGYYETNGQLAAQKADTCDIINITSADIDPEYNNGYRYKIAIHYVAQVTATGVDRKFATLKGALDYARTINNSTVTILDDCNFETDGQYGYALGTIGKTMTIDLNNHTVNATNSETSYDRVFAVTGQITITDNSVAKGGKLNLTKAHNGTFLGIVFNDASQLTLANGTIYVENTTASKAVEALNIWGTTGIFRQTGGTLQAKATSATATGIQMRGTAEISGGNVIVTSDGSYARAFVPAADAANSKYGSITVSGTPTITVSGAGEVSGVYANVAGTTTTISGGTWNITSTTSTAYGVRLSKANTATISGGTFNVTATTTNAYGIYVSGGGSGTVSGGTFTSRTGANKNESFGAYATGTGTTLNITGGTFDVNSADNAGSNINVVRVQPGATVTISGGTFRSGATSGYGLVSFGGVTTVSGTALFEAYTGAYVGSWYQGDGTNDELATVNLNGGTFNVTGIAINATWNTRYKDGVYLSSPFINSIVNVNGGRYKTTGGTIVQKKADGADGGTAVLNIAGGYFNEKSGTTFKDQIATYVADTSEINTLDPLLEGIYKYEVAPHYVAKVQTGSTTKYHTTAKAAFDYAKTVANPTIMLLDNCTLTEANYTINPGTTWTATLDLNNFTLTPTVDATYGRAFTIGGTGTKFIVTDNSVGQGGQIYYKGNSSVSIIYFVVAGGEMELAGGTLYVENTNASKKAIGFVVDGNPSQFTQSAGTFTIKGAYGANGYYGKGTATFTGGTMNVDGGAYQAIGLYPYESTSKLNVSGTFALNVTSSLADSYGVLVKNSGATGTINGGKFKFDQNTMVAAQVDGSLTINGGYFCEHPSQAGRYKSQINSYKGSKVIMDLDAADAEYIAGYRYLVTDDPVAKVKAGSEITYYTTLPAAFNYAKTQNNAEVTLLKDVVSTSTYTWSPSSAISNTFDLNGHSLSSTTGTVLGVGKAGATLTIKDTPGGGSISYSSTTGGWNPTVHVGNGKLVLQGGTISRATDDGVAVGVQAYTTADATPEFEMTGGKVETSAVTYAYSVLVKSTGSNYATATISGGEVSATATGTYAFALTAAYKGEITVKGTNNPKISATDATTGTQVARNEGNGAIFTIEGGLFKASRNASPFSGTITISGGYFNEYGSTTTYKTQIENRCVSPKHPIALTAAEQAALGEGGTNYKYKVVDAYTLTWNLAGGTVTTAGTQAPVDATGTPSGYVEQGASITVPTVTKTGYTFAGWSSAPAATMPAANTTYTATWTRDTYTISYDLAGGSVTSPNPTSYTVESSAITLNNPTKANYVFAGWTGTGLAEPTMTFTIPAGSTGNRSYTATWTAAVASVHVGAGAKSYFTTLAAALDDAKTKDNAIITVLKDITGQTALTYDVAKTCTLDLNNHLVKGAVSTKLLNINKSGSTFVITDESVDKGGELYNEKSGEETYYGVYLTAGTLKLLAGKVHAKNTKDDYASATTAAKRCMARGVGVASGQTFQMSGGEVEGESIYAGYGVETAGTTTISGGTIHAKTSKFTVARGIFSSGSTTITGGTIKATAYTTTAQGIYVNGGTTSINSGDSVIIESKSTTSSTVSGIYVNSGTFNANTGCKLRASVEAKTSTTYGVYVAGGRTANIYAGKFIVKSTTGTAYGVYSSGTTKIYGGMFNVSTGTSTKAYGIYADRGTVTVNNSPEFTVHAGTKTAYGVYATGYIPAKGATPRSTKTFDSSVTINGGTFSVSTGSAEGAYGAVATRVSKVVYSTTSDSVPGNYARKGSLVIEDGVFDVTSATTTSYGVWCNSAVTADKYTGSGDNAGSVTATPTLTVNGGKFKMTSTNDANATAYAMNTNATNANLLVQGGYYSTKKTSASTNIESKYTHSGKGSSLYRVFDVVPALESKYNYKVARFYTITYNKGANGTGTIAAEYKAHGDDFTLSSSTFTRTGYTQTGWSTSDGGAKAYELGGTYAENADITLYPFWTAQNYTVTLNNQSATTAGTTSITVTYNSNTNLTATPAITVPTKTGYTFGGYYVDQGGSGKQVIAANGNVNASVSGITDASKNWIASTGGTIYAKWTQTVTLHDNNGGIHNGSLEVTYNSTYKSGTPPTREGYTAEGYYAEPACTNKVLTTAAVWVNYSGWVEGGKWVHDGESTLYTKWIEDTHTVTVAAGANGSASPASVTAGITTASGTITATPNTGYHFDNWTIPAGVTIASGSTTSPSITINATADDLTITANFAANTNTAYTVKHYKQNLAGDGYDLADTDNLTGTTGASVTPAVKSYEGFTAPSTQTVTILADGSRVVTYNYTRNSYTLAWALDGGSISVAGTPAGSVKYGASLTAPTVTKTGYTFAGWSPDVPATMPASDATYTATWTADTYTVTLDRNSGTSGATSVTMTYNSSTMTGYSKPGRTGYTFGGYYTSESSNNGTGDQVINKDGVLQANVDGYTGAGGVWIRTTATTLYAKWSQNRYYITFTHNGNGTISYNGTTIAAGGTARVYQVSKKALVATPNTGYHFTGWTVTGSNAGKVTIADLSAATTTIVATGGTAATVTVTAGFAPNTNTAYTVKHYKQKLDGTYDATPDDIDELTGTTGASVTPAVKSYTGFTAPSTQTETIAADGSMVIEYQYTRNSYTLTWNLDGGSISVAGTPAGSVKYGASLTAPTVEKAGYTFADWTPEVAATMPAEATTYTATWTPVVRLIFTGATDNQWSKSSNWDPACVPTEAHDIYIQKPCSVDIEHAVAKSIVIDQSSSHTGKLTVGANKGLEVVGTISRTTTGEDNLPTRTEDLVLETSTTGNASLIFNNSNSNAATVDLYSKGYIDGSGTKNYQYIGVPVTEANALYNFYGSWMYSWGIKKNGAWGWVSVKNGASVYPWTGYCITQQEPTYYAIEGTLVPTTTKDITVPADENMVVGNSWTAPIDISAFEDDDFKNLEGNVYFFNVGIDKDKEHDIYATSDRYAGGTYVTVPIHAASYTDDDHINSMQGFFVKNTGESEGTLHLDYEKHVRGTTRGSIIGDALHAPKHAQAEEPVVLKIKVSGENYDDKLLLLEREDFSTGFDNGWDGDKWDGNESALYLYTTDSEGTENSVSAVPELEGTVIGFRAGEDDGYTLHFDYLNSDEPLYLYDTQTRSYTRIETGATYWFLTNDKEKHARFIITRTEGQEIATGLTPNYQSEEAKAKKLLIEDKMFILVNGMLFDATGKIVK